MRPKIKRALNQNYFRPKLI